MFVAHVYLACCFFRSVQYRYYKKNKANQFVFVPQEFDNRELENEEENNDLCEALEKSLEEIDASSRVPILESDYAKKVDIGECNSNENCTKIPEMSVPEKKEEVLWTGYLARFGHSSLKQFQKDAIHAVQQARDTIIIQPTASGKSICFQIPALLDERFITLVICPTISLINSHVENLKLHGINSSSLGPASSTSSIQSLLSTDKGDLPPLLFTTPEYFSTKVKSELMEMKSFIKMLVLDEIHKMFDRNYNFRSCYDSFKTLKEDFEGIPIMALTATLDDSQLVDLSNNYLRCPVVIKGNVNKKNTKLNVENYQKIRRKEGDDMWHDLAKELVSTIQDDYAIVYMDFKVDVERFVKGLIKAGLHDVKAYHGKMSSEMKSKVDNEFRNKEFQVLVATEAYEVGTHSPHVNLVFRIGCMRNIAVLVQEFGRAGRNNDSSDGIILVNEGVDDQRLIYWTKGCLASEIATKKAEYENCWKWLYGLQTGTCLRKSLLENFQSSDVFEQAASGECCSSCDISAARDFNCKESAVLLLNALEEVRKLPITKGGVSEDKAISWLRGCKQSWISSSDIQEFIDSSQSYSKGVRMNGRPIKKEWWSTHLRQLIHLGLIKISFNIHSFGYFTRASRSYAVTEKGKTFLEKPCDLLVLNPQAFEDSKAKDSKTKRTSKSTNRNKHYLPKIRELLLDNKRWSEIKERGAYEYPGFETKENNINYCKDIKKAVGFGSCQRPHFMWDDCQLTKGATSTHSDLNTEVELADR